MHEPTITVVGHVADAPRLRFIDGGVAVADFRLASTPRKRDKAGDWSDRETIWFGVTIWRGLAEHAAASIKKGDRVVCQGTLTSRVYEAEGGERRANLEIAADSVGLELSRGTASYVKAARLVTDRDPGSFSVVTGEVFQDEPVVGTSLEDPAAELDEHEDERSADREPVPV